MADTQNLRGVATISYYAADLAAARRWYSELLGIEPYFERQVGGLSAYVEFRLGDYQDELGIIDSRYAPQGAAAGAGVWSHTGTSTTWQPCSKS